MTISTPADRIELAELLKVTTKRKTAHMWKHNMERIDHAVTNGGSRKAVKRRRRHGENHLYAFKDKQVRVITSRDKIVIIPEEFYRNMYSSRDIQVNTERGSISEEVDIPPVIKEKLRKLLKK